MRVLPMIKYYFGLAQNRDKTWSFFFKSHLPKTDLICFYLPLIIPQYFFRNANQIFFEQLYLMQKMGLSLSKSLEILSTSPKPCFPVEVLQSLHQALEEGWSFKQIFENHAQYFSPMLLSFLRISHHSGNFLAFMDIWLQEEKKIRAFRHEISQQLAYPCLFILLWILFIHFFLTQTLPLYQSLSLQIQKHPPIIFEWILKLQSYSICIPIIFLGMFWYRRPLFNHSPIKKTFDWWVWSAAMQICLKNGLSWLEAFQLIENSFQDLHFQKWLKTSQTQLRLGTPFEKCFSKAPHMVLHYLPLLKTTPYPDFIMENLKHYFSKEFEKKLSKIARYTQPILMVGMACFIGLSLMMMYQPLFEIGFNL
jgi:type IV pilus assembly protein PilC